MLLLEYFIFGLVSFLMTGAEEVTEVFAEEGSPAVLPCKCSPSFPFPSAIVWKQANKGTVWRKLKSGLQYWGGSWFQKGHQRVRCPHSQFESGDYSLEIFSVRQDDGGVYSCLVQHGDQSVQSVVMLRVIKVSVSPVDPFSGDDVSITCNVTPWPLDANVQWNLNNSPFVTDTTPKNVANRVVTEKATWRLTGKWTCVVNHKGKEVRSSASLSVKGIIQPPKDNTKVYAAVGSAVTLPCVFAPGLNTSEPVWEKLKPGFLFKPTPGRLPASFSLSSPSSQGPWDKSATVEEVGFEDEGKYRCSGTIGDQRLTRNMQLVVAKVDSSTPSKKKASVTLTCQLTDTSEITKYEWVHVTYDLNGTQSVGSIQTGKTLSISTVSDENQGEWACRFYGKESILGNITYHVQLMGGLNGQKPTGLSHNAAAVTGLSILLVVLLLIVAQMYKNYQRRKRIFQYPALETMVHTISIEREERERNRLNK